MYNEEQKLRFISQYAKRSSTERMLVSFFNSLEKYEREWGADVCTQKEDALKLLMDDRLGLMKSSRDIKLSYLRSYVQWCINERVPGVCPDLIRVKDSGGDAKMREQMVATPLQLEGYLNKVFDPVEMQSTDIVYRCYLWIAFGGVKEKTDAIEITKADLNFNSRSIVYKKHLEATMYKYGVDALKFAATSPYFKVYNPKSVANRARADGDSILRGLIRTPVRTDHIDVKLARKETEAVDSGRVKRRLTYGKVWYSGVFYRLYQREVFGATPNFNDVAEQWFKDDGFLTPRENFVNKKKMELEEDYYSWKTAFNLD